MDYGERLASVIVELGMKKRAFADAMDITPYYLSSLLNGKNRPSRPLATAVESRYGISAEWLMTGEGDMRKRTDIVGDLAEFQRIPPADRRRLLDLYKTIKTPAKK